MIMSECIICYALLYSATLSEMICELLDALYYKVSHRVESVNSSHDLILNHLHVNVI